MSEPILTARGLVKTYASGDGRLQVLAGVDLDVGPGESVSIRGESGSGKSTLLNLLSGLDSPDQGSVLWENAPDTGAHRRSAFLGMVFQSYYLVPELNAVENIALAARIRGTSAGAAKEKAQVLLAKVGLGARAGHLPAQLSGGERQRVAVARALVNSPRLILADEPTGNLDDRIGGSVIELIFGLCAEFQTALVLVTHNAGHADRASRRLTMAAGRLS